MTDDTDEWIPEDRAFFTGSLCQCEHDPGQHGWTGCGVEGCTCAAHWEY